MNIYIYDDNFKQTDRIKEKCSLSDSFRKAKNEYFQYHKLSHDVLHLFFSQFSTQPDIVVPSIYQCPAIPDLIIKINELCPDGYAQIRELSTLSGQDSDISRECYKIYKDITIDIESMIQTESY